MTPENEVFIAKQFVLVTLRERHVGTPYMTPEELFERSANRNKNLSLNAIQQAIKILVEEFRVKYVRLEQEKELFGESPAIRVQATLMDRAEESQTALTWVAEYLPELRKRYPGMWIAVKDFEVKAAAKNAKKLKELWDKFDIKSPFITQINKLGKKDTWVTAF